MMVNTNYYKKVVAGALALAERKNADYTGDKVDNLAITGVSGISVRMLDKVARVYNLTSGAKQQVNDESVRDTFVDIINYAVFAVMMIDKQWGSDAKEEIENQPNLPGWEIPTQK